MKALEREGGCEGSGLWGAEGIGEPREGSAGGGPGDLLSSTRQAGPSALLDAPARRALTGCWEALPPEPTQHPECPLHPCGDLLQPHRAPP